MSPRLKARPRHGTVVAYLALFLALAGGAVAAATIGSGDVVNNSLKSADLKNAAGVKGADVKQSSLRGPDVRNGNVGGPQVAADSLTGADVNEPSLVVSQVVNRLGGPLGTPLPTPAPVPIPGGTYTQAANETNQLLAGGQVTFSPACIQPRVASFYLLADSPVLAVENIVALGQVVDNNAGASTRNFTFGSGGVGLRSATLFRSAAPQNHQLFVYGIMSCNSGSGATLDSAGVDVIGKR